MIEPERTLLFSDFRYAEAGRAVEGVESWRPAARSRPTRRERSGRVGFEADAVTYSQYEILQAAGSSSYPGAGSSRRCAR